MLGWRETESPMLTGDLNSVSLGNVCDRVTARGKTMERTMITLRMMLGVAFLLPVSGAFGMQILGDNIGIISAVVAAADAERGLTVRTSPLAESPAQAFLPVGTRVKGYATFKNGYVKIEDPFKGGWIRLDHLQPVGGAGTVTRVDQPELCLRIRSGPATSYDKVGCAELGRQLELTGLWSRNNWAQLSKPVSGWVTASQIASDLKPTSAVSETRVSEEPISSTLLPEATPARRQRVFVPDGYRWRGPAGYGWYYPYSGVDVHINIGGKKHK